MKSKNKNHYEAILAITLLLLLIQWRFNIKYGLLVIAGFVLLSLLSKSFTAICYKRWMLLAKGLNAISSFLLLSLIFLLVLLPTALFSKLFNKSAIKFKPVTKNSNLVVTNKQYSNLDFVKPG
jgi:hypothetical protein